MAYPFLLDHIIIVPLLCCLAYALFLFFLFHIYIAF
jgi:hypothetical protein